MNCSTSPLIEQENKQASHTVRNRTIFEHIPENQCDSMKIFIPKEVFSFVFVF